MQGILAIALCLLQAGEPSSPATSVTSPEGNPMTMRTLLRNLAGEWTGTNQVWVMPGDPVRESATAASIALAARDGFVTIRYTWAEGGQPQDGLLIVRNAAGPSEDDMVWIDSWHTAGAFMHFSGEPDREGRMSAMGSYGAPSGPAWGWRIELSAPSADEFHVRMYNIPPGRGEVLAVESLYSRVRARQ